MSSLENGSGLTAAKGSAGGRFCGRHMGGEALETGGEMEMGGGGVQALSRPMMASMVKAARAAGRVRGGEGEPARAGLRAKGATKGPGADGLWRAPILCCCAGGLARAATCWALGLRAATC